MPRSSGAVIWWRRESRGKERSRTVTGQCSTSAQDQDSQSSICTCTCWVTKSALAARIARAITESSMFDIPGQGSRRSTFSLLASFLLHGLILFLWLDRAPIFVKPSFVAWGQHGQSDTLIYF